MPMRSFGAKAATLARERHGAVLAVIGAAQPEQSKTIKNLLPQSQFQS